MDDHHFQELVLRRAEILARIQQLLHHIQSLLASSQTTFLHEQQGCNCCQRSDHDQDLAEENHLTNG